MRRHLEEIIEREFYQRCLWCKMKHRCGKDTNAACRQEVRDRVTAQYEQAQIRVKERMK